MFFIFVFIIFFLNGAGTRLHSLVSAACDAADYPGRSKGPGWPPYCFFLCTLHPEMGGCLGFSCRAKLIRKRRVGFEVSELLTRLFTLACTFLKDTGGLFIFCRDQFPSAAILQNCGARVFFTRHGCRMVFGLSSNGNLEFLASHQAIVCINSHFATQRVNPFAQIRKT